MTIYQPMYDLDQQVLSELKMIIGSAIGILLITIIIILIICKWKGVNQND